VSNEENTDYWRRLQTGQIAVNVFTPIPGHGASSHSASLQRLCRRPAFLEKDVQAIGYAFVTGLCR